MYTACDRDPASVVLMQMIYADLYPRPGIYPKFYGKKD